MIKIATVIEHWLRSKDIDPSKIAVVILADAETRSRIQIAVDRELRVMVLNKKTAPRWYDEFKISGIMFRLGLFQQPTRHGATHPAGLPHD